MKRIILFITAIILLTGGNALAQFQQNYGPGFPVSNRATGQQGGAVYGPAGIQNLYDPYGTVAAARQFGTPSGVVTVQGVYGGTQAPPQIGTSQGYGR